MNNSVLAKKLWKQYVITQWNPVDKHRQGLIIGRGVGSANDTKQERLGGMPKDVVSGLITVHNHCIIKEASEFLERKKKIISGCTNGQKSVLLVHGKT